MKKIIVYDFDKTLTKNDTLLSFFIFNEKRNFFFFMKLCTYFFLMVFAKVKIISNYKLKDYGVKIFLRNLTQKESNHKFFYFKDHIKFNFLYNKTDFSKQNIYIVSASFEEYLRPIFSENIKILASTLTYENNRIKALKFNCYGRNKLKRLEGEDISEIDLFYTDSMSDLPLVKISKRIILIKNNMEFECKDVDDFIKKVTE